MEDQPGFWYTACEAPMKQSILLLLLAFALNPLAEARDYITPRSAMARYDACAKFLRMSRPEQNKVIRRTTLGYAEGVRSCRSVVSRGRKKTLEDAKEWNRWEASGGRRGRSSGGTYEAPYCGSSSSCGALEHCYGGRCVGQSNRCISDSQCSGGNTCSSDGLCGR